MEAQKSREDAESFRKEAEALRKQAQPGRTWRVAQHSTAGTWRITTERQFEQRHPGWLLITRGLKYLIYWRFLWYSMTIYDLFGKLFSTDQNNGMTEEPSQTTQVEAIQKQAANQASEPLSKAKPVRLVWLAGRLPHVGQIQHMDPWEITMNLPYLTMECLTSYWYLGTMVKTMVKTKAPRGDVFSDQLRYMRLDSENRFPPHCRCFATRMFGV